MTYHFRGARHSVASDITINYKARKVEFSNNWSIKRMFFSILRGDIFMTTYFYVLSIFMLLTMFLSNNYSFFNIMTAILVALLHPSLLLLDLFLGTRFNMKSFFLKKRKVRKIHEIFNPLKIVMIVSELIEIEYEGDTTTPGKILEFKTKDVLNGKRVRPYHELMIAVENQCRDGKVTIKEF